MTERSKTPTFAATQFITLYDIVSDITLHNTENNETMIIGQRIRQIFDTKPRTCTVEWFARSLDCKRRNIYRIFERDNIDIRLLVRIGDILQHDFFADISAGIVAVPQLPKQSNDNTTMTDID